MIGYIRDPRTWSAVKTVTVTSYELPLETAQGETGKVTLLGQLDADYSQYALSVEGVDSMFKITGQQTGTTEETTLTLQDFIGLLEGNRRFAPSETVVNYNFLVKGGTSIFCLGLFAYSAIVNNITKFPTHGGLKPSYFCFELSSSDANKIQNKQIQTDSFTKIGNVYSQEEVLRAIRNNGFSVSFKDRKFGNESFKTFVVGGSLDEQPIAFDDGHSFLISESYKDDVCSTVYVSVENPNYQHPFDVFTISTGEHGTTDMVERDAENYETAQAQAEEIFNQNTHSHKIEFASDKELHIGQPVRLMLSRGVLDTAISKVMLKSGDDRFYYTCGELPVTATERIKADGWTYGSRLPSNPRKGQLFIEV